MKAPVARQGSMSSTSLDKVRLAHVELGYARKMFFSGPKARTLDGK